MKIDPLSYRFLLAVPLLALLWFFCAPGYGQQADEPAQASDAPSSSSSRTIPIAHRIQPAELARTLRSPTSKKPLILQVGSHVLYTEAHIAGSEYAGPGRQSAGLRKLRDRVRKLNRNQPIVIYCGCCPWDKCPNIRPAYRQLISMGFTHVQALYIADNFGTDWVDKGYPVAKGR